LNGEADRLQLMSRILDPSTRHHLEVIGIAPGWKCLEVGAGNGSVSEWIAARVGPQGHVLATDIHTDLLRTLSGDNIDVRAFDVVHDNPVDQPFDLIVARALLHHLPERRAVVSRMARWLKPGAWLFIQEPDFYPTWTVQPKSQHQLWESFIRWAETQQIDYYAGRKIPAWLQDEGLTKIQSEGHAILYNGGSDFAHWWTLGLQEVAEKLKTEGDVSEAELNEFFSLAQEPAYWTTTIAFTATAGRRLP
jgi:SAM-dependent methyltransferase